MCVASCGRIHPALCSGIQVASLVRVGCSLCATPGTHVGVLSLQVLAELKEYATEVDVDFVRKAVRAIGRCAIKVEASI